MYVSKKRIVPAIIPTSFEKLVSTVSTVSGFAKQVQIDVVDGKFAPHTSWPYTKEDTTSANEIKENLKGVSFEVDLMTTDQIPASKFWIDAGATALVFHLEGLEDPDTAIDLCKTQNVKVGFAINNDTSLEKLFPFINKINFVQLMGIASIGSQGQPFDNRVLERVVTLKSLYPNLEISVDGSVNKSTISELDKAGVDRFTVGSYIVKSDSPGERYTELLKIIS